MDGSIVRAKRGSRWIDEADVNHEPGRSSGHPPPHHAEDLLNMSVFNASPHHIYALVSPHLRYSPHSPHSPHFEAYILPGEHHSFPRVRRPKIAVRYSVPYSRDPVAELTVLSGESVIFTRKNELVVQERGTEWLGVDGHNYEPHNVLVSNASDTDIHVTATWRHGVSSSPASESSNAGQNGRQAGESSATSTVRPCESWEFLPLLSASLEVRTTPEGEIVAMATVGKHRSMIFTMVSSLVLAKRGSHWVDEADINHYPGQSSGGPYPFHAEDRLNMSVFNASRRGIHATVESNLGETRSAEAEIPPGEHRSFPRVRLPTVAVRLLHSSSYIGPTRHSSSLRGVPVIAQRTFRSGQSVIFTADNELVVRGQGDEWVDADGHDYARDDNGLDKRKEPKMGLSKVKYQVY